MREGPLVELAVSRRGRRERGLPLALVLLTTLLLACNARQVTPPTPDVAPSRTEPSPSARDPIADAIEWRRSLDLRADEAYVRTLAHGPGAIAHAEFAGFQYPLTESEIRELLRRNRDMGEISRKALEYARTQPTEFAGAYVDTANSRYVFLVTDNVVMHRQRLYARLPAGAPIVVAQVRWSLAELEPIVDRIRQDDAFFSDLGVFAITNVVEAENLIEIELNTDDPADAARVRARYGNDPRLRIRIVGRGPWDGGRGNVTVRLTDRDGLPVSPDGAVCLIVADDVRAWSSDEPDRAVVGGECRFGNVGATGVEAQVRAGTAAGRLLGSGRGVVAAGGTMTITVVVEGPE